MKTVKHKLVGHPVSPIFGIGMGVIVCLLLTILLSAITAWLVSGGSLRQDAIGVLSAPISFVATFVGCITATILVGNMPAVIVGACAGCYFAILLFGNILFMNSSFGGVGKGLIGIVVGAAIALILNVFLSSRNRNKSRRRR